MGLYLQDKDKSIKLKDLPVGKLGILTDPNNRWCGEVIIKHPGRPSDFIMVGTKLWFSNNEDFDDDRDNKEHLEWKCEVIETNSNLTISY